MVDVGNDVLNAFVPVHTLLDPNKLPPEYNASPIDFVINCELLDVVVIVDVGNAVLKLVAPEKLLLDNHAFVTPDANCP